MGLFARINSLTREAPARAGRRVRIISGACLAEAAQTFGMPPREAEAAALLAGIVPERYLRNMGSFTPEEQARLLQSRAAVIGLGGLGGTVLEILARSGVGRLRAADGDRFEESNLNRQLLCQTQTVGMAKTQAAHDRIKAVNPAVELETFVSYLADSEMPSFLEGAQVAVDALGGLSQRVALQKAASGAGIPLVTAAVAGAAGYVATVLPGGRGPAECMGGGSRESGEELLGTPAPAVFLAASVQAAECLRILSGKTPSLAGRMLAFDLDAAAFETVIL